MASLTQRLKALVRKITYMFYDQERIMVMEGFLMYDEPMQVKDLIDRLHLQKKTIDDALGILRRDGMIALKTELDLEGWDKKIEQMSENQKKQRTRYYYAIDYKVFCDSVRLKIALVKKYLKEQCGKEDNISYFCEHCNMKLPLVEIVSYTDNGEIICPSCEGPLKELDNSDEINVNKRKYDAFCELTDDIRKDIDRMVKNMVFEKSFDKRISPANFMKFEDYEVKRKMIKEKLDSGKQQFEIQINQENKNVVVIKKDEKDTKVSDAAKDLFAKFKDEGEKKLDQDAKDLFADSKDQSGKKDETEKPEITVNGVTYSPQDLSEDLIITLECSEDDRGKLWDFFEKYC